MKNISKALSSLASITILAIILTLSPTVLSGVKAPTEVVSGFGMGTLTCPNRLTFNNEQIQFEVTGKKVTSGIWNIGALNPAHPNSGSINGIDLSSKLNDISIHGSENQDNICQSGSIVKVNYISITGKCNTNDAVISFAALDGKKGSFKGTIICNLIR
jgi:hypothetical protein